MQKLHDQVNCPWLCLFFLRSCYCLGELMTQKTCGEPLSWGAVVCIVQKCVPNPLLWLWDCLGTVALPLTPAAVAVHSLRPCCGSHAGPGPLIDFLESLWYPDQERMKYLLDQWGNWCLWRGNHFHKGCMSPSLSAHTHFDYELIPFKWCSFLQLRVTPRLINTQSPFSLLRRNCFFFFCPFL